MESLSAAHAASRALRRLVPALAFVLALAGAATAEVRILAFGDLLTAGSGLPPHEGFAPQLEAWLHAHGAADVTVINAGVPGETSAGGLARIGTRARPRRRRASSSSSAPTTCCAASTSARCATTSTAS